MQPPTLTPTTDLIHGWGERCGERSGAVVTKCHRVEPPFAACTNYCPYGIDAERQREISEFAERKRIAIMCASKSGRILCKILFVNNLQIIIIIIITRFCPANQRSV